MTNIIEAIAAAKKAVCEMCSEVRCPKMRIPVQESDEDRVLMRVINYALTAEDQLTASRKVLVEIFEEQGIDWPGDDLHLADVIEKHLWRHLIPDPEDARPKWTSDKPTEEGWYAWKMYEDSQGQIARVGQSDDKCWYVWDRYGNAYCLCGWFGPKIVLPGDGE
jgi:hypothetical protein